MICLSVLGLSGCHSNNGSNANSSSKKAENIKSVTSSVAVNKNTQVISYSQAKVDHTVPVKVSSGIHSCSQVSKDNGTNYSRK